MFETTSQCQRSLRAATILLVLTVAGCGSPEPDPLEIRFEARVGEAVAKCGVRYDGVGASASTVELGDARLYVSNVALRKPDGTFVPLALAQETPWQHETVALLDFEDGTGRCSEVGTAETNAVVRGTIPPGEYSGLRFEIGVPWSLNHLDATTAPSPLNLNALYWNWQFGYIFTKIEYWNAEVDLGSESTDLWPATAGAIPTRADSCRAFT